MKITAVEAIPVRMPLRKSYDTALSFRTPLAEKCMEHIVIRLHTDEGLFGIGEAASSPAWPRGLTQGAVLDIIRTLAPLLTGRNPVHIAEIVPLLERAMADCPFPLAGIDMALHDLAAKALGLPLYDLLGGLIRPRIELHYSIGIADPETMAGEAKRAAERGFNHFKVKVGNPDFSVEREALRAIRAAVPAARIRLDANQGWYAAQAVQRLRILQAEVGIELVEQPVPYNDLYGLAHVRRQVDVPVMADESCFSPADAIRIVREEAADILNIKLMKCGGLHNARKICAIAEAAGLSCFVGSMVEMEIGHAAGLHLAASQEVVRYPTGIHGGMGRESIVKEAWPVEGGFLTMPGRDKLGLGLEIDEDVLERYRVDR